MWLPCPSELMVPRKSPGSARGRASQGAADHQRCAGLYPSGGIIGLVRSENKMAFEINLKMARESSLDPSAPMLELAVVVE